MISDEDDTGSAKTGPPATWCLNHLKLFLLVEPSNMSPRGSRTSREVLSGWSRILVNLTCSHDIEKSSAPFLSREPTRSAGFSHQT